ncbi:SAM-dependent methyltransferase, partial [Thauera humireducens]|uniref:SAM-dependent methyltransferase n=1 Tax=Thauera humireducens TaxID=1134435 RepID=UPI00311E7AC2
MNDIGVRESSVLAAVDVVAAEDTRHSQRLLDAFGLTTRILPAVHQHNEQEAAGRLIALLESGQQVALITDAGTPAVSDPGAKLVARVRAAGHPVLPCPGRARRWLRCRCPALPRVASALSASCHRNRPRVSRRCRPCLTSGMRWCSTKRRTASSTARQKWPAESSLVRDGADLRARSLKLHEQIVRMPLGETAAWFAGDANRSRGEFVLVLGGAPD